MQSDYGYAQLQNHVEELQGAEQYVRMHEDSHEADQEYQNNNHQDEWMLLCQLNPVYDQQSNDESHVDWEAAANELPRPLLLSCPNWINTAKAQNDQTLHVRQFTPIDTVNLNQKQRRAYTIVSSHFNNQDEDQVPLRMMILGTAGTRKSYLIWALAQLLGCRCLLTATTGIAAYNVGGITVHSALSSISQSK